MQTEFCIASNPIHLYVAYSNAVGAQAMAVGATSVAEVADKLCGNRFAPVTNPSVNHWSLPPTLKT